MGISARDKVRYKKFYNLFVVFLTRQFFKKVSITTIVKCFNRCSGFASVLMIVILFFREMVFQRQIRGICLKRHHYKKVIGRFWPRIFFPPFLELKVDFQMGSFALELFFMKLSSIALHLIFSLSGFVISFEIDSISMLFFSQKNRTASI